MAEKKCNMQENIGNMEEKSRNIDGKNRNMEEKSDNTVVNFYYKYKSARMIMHYGTKHKVSATNPGKPNGFLGA